MRALWLLITGVCLLITTDSPVSSASNNAARAASKPELVLQTGHSYRVDGLAFSPDGKLVASGSADNTVKLWDALTGRELRSLAGHSSWVKAVAFSHDGRLLAAGTTDGQVKFWDVVTGSVTRSFSDCGSVTAVAFSPDGRWFAAGNMEKAIKVWEAATGRETHTLTGHSDWVTALDFSRDGRRLASGSKDNTVKLWEVATGGRIAHTLTGHSDRVGAVAFSPDGQVLASGGFDKTVKLWEVASGREHKTLAGHSDKVIAVAFSPDGRWVNAGSVNKTIKIWDRVTGAEGRTLTLPAGASSIGAVEVMAFSADAGRLALSSGDKTVRLWDVSSGAARTLDSHSSRVYATAFSPDGRWFASGCSDDSVKLWETATGRVVRTLRGRAGGYVNAVAFRPDSQFLISGALSGAIKIYDVVTGREVRNLTGHSDSVNGVAFSPDGRSIVSASNDSTVKLWDASTGREAHSLKGHSAEVYAVAFSSNGKLLASGGADNAIKLWDAGAGVELRTLTGHAGEVHAVALSPNGKLLASGGKDASIKLWEVETGRELRALGGHTVAAAWTKALAFSPDGLTLVSGGADGRIKSWEVATGREARDLAGHSDTVRSVGFSADGRWLASGSEDGTTRIWDAATGELGATLVAMREETGNLTDWLVVTPDGLFDGSPAAWDQILWRFGGNTFNSAPVEIFFNEFFYPDLLADVLAGGKPRAAQSISQVDRRQPQLKLMTAASANAPAGASVSSRLLNVRVEVTEALAGAHDVRLFRNGSLVKVWRGDVLKGQNRATLDAEIPVVAGENRLTAYAFNRDNVKSADAMMDINGADTLKRAGTTYVLVAGINEYANPQYNLKYAVADAQAFADEVRLQQNKLNSSAKIETIFLQDREATKANILTALNRLAGIERGALPASAPVALEKIKPAEPEDTVVLYFAGHGTAQKDDFYLIPHDLGYDGDRTGIDEASLRKVLEHCISDRELEKVFERIDVSQLLLVIDACNSGQALEAEEKRRGPMNSKGLAQLAYEKGMYVLTAAQSYQAALETAQLGHGLLTYALVVEGLKQGAADAQPARDGQITVREWLDYATARVPQIQLTKLKQSKNERGIGLAFVEGEEKIGVERRSLQRPRVFYRREADARPLIMARLEAVQ